MSARGYGWTAASVTLAVAGLWWGNGVMLTLALAGLLALLVAWVVGRWQGRGIEVEWEGPRVVVVGMPARVRMRVRKRAGGELRGLDLSGDGPGGVAFGGRVPALSAGQEMEVDDGFCAVRRGVRAHLGWRLAWSDPWGLFDFEKRGDWAKEMVVLPRGVRPLPGEVLSVGWGEAFPPRGLATGERGDWRGLRAHRPGDSPRAVRWPESLRSVASGGGLLVAEEDPPGGEVEQVTLIFHSLAEGGLIQPDRFERALALWWGETELLVDAGIVVRWTADFLEWVPLEISRRGDLAVAGEVVARAQRAKGTQRHEVEGRLQEVAGALRIFSDVPMERWERWAGEARVARGPEVRKGGRR
ncbi:hypothetical protein HNR46_001838 [Haloferula luteola]|uniref:DUF58 domain-containing protein n=1 Tax=Haloferula luteola TaxID=595692 RepID=A0A840VFM5_9BACT|nr:hypothetical protein [Haloferula luteola]MBB5351601.1 hypothetical protein [Haloferula luteola]